MKIAKLLMLLAVALGITWGVMVVGGAFGILAGALVGMVGGVTATSLFQIFLEIYDELENRYMVRHKDLD